MFMIEDEIHDEVQGGEFQTREQAVAELERRAAIPWDAEPNVAPCTSWRGCRRRYVLVEYESSRYAASREAMLEVDASGVRWIATRAVADRPASTVRNNTV